MQVFKVIRQLMLILTIFWGVTFYVNAYQPWSNTSGFNINNAQQAAQKVKGRFGGKVLKVQRTKVNGNPGYKVKVLKDNGHVISVKIDARTGKISGK